MENGDMFLRTEQGNYSNWLWDGSTCMVRSKSASGRFQTVHMKEKCCLGVTIYNKWACFHFRTFGTGDLDFGSSILMGASWKDRIKNYNHNLYQWLIFSNYFILYINIILIVYILIIS